jgi:hypothetical protein
MAEENFEVSNPILGNLKVSSANLNNIITLLSFVLIVLLCWVLWQHEVSAQAADKSGVAAIVKSNQDVAQALKDFGTGTTEALKDLTVAQRKTNCLLAIPPDQRNNADAICDRILRGR